MNETFAPTDYALKRDSPDKDRTLHVMALVAFAIWMIAGVLPALDEDIGFLAWLYGLFFAFPVGAVATIANGHVLIAAIDAVRYFQREVNVVPRFPWFGLIGILLTSMFIIVDIITPDHHVSDPSIGTPQFTFGAYVYMAALGVSVMRMTVMVWTRASDSPI